MTTNNIKIKSMSLDDINKELYKRNSGIIAGHTHETSEFDPTVGAQNSSPFNREEAWQKESQEVRQKKKKRALIIGLSVFAAIVFVIGGIFLFSWWQKNAFHQDRVTVSIEGPREADSTQITKYVIRYKNNNRVTLKNVELSLSYPENFSPTNNTNFKRLGPSSGKIFIEDIKPKAEGFAELNGIFYAPKDAPVFLRAELAFIPSNGTAQLAIENQINVNITAAPMTLTLAAPKNAADGDEVAYVVSYKNIDTKVMENIQVRIDFPQGFQMDSSEPVPSEKDSYWYLGNLEAEQSGEITIKGRLFGNAGEKENIAVSLGQIGSERNFIAFNKQESSTEITMPILAIKQSLDGKDESENVINPGDVLRYAITYHNTGDIVLRDAIVTAEVKGKVLDFSKIKPEKGSYNSATGLMTWKASDVPELGNILPKSEGKVYFSIPVKSVIPVESALDKNYTVSSIAKIDSPDIPTPIDANKVIGSNRLVLKLSSKVLFDIRAYYKDDIMQNSGPIPMESGTETMFSVHWAIMNVSNDIAEAKVVASLPSGVRWTGRGYPEGENISYNQRTNEVIWNAGNVPAGTGILAAQREITFQVGVTPQLNQVGEPIVLVNKSVFTAKDTFVEKEIKIEKEPKDTQLPEDPTVGYTNGKVAK